MALFFSYLSQITPLKCNIYIYIYIYIHIFLQALVIERIIICRDVNTRDSISMFGSFMYMYMCGKIATIVIRNTPRHFAPSEIYIR